MKARGGGAIVTPGDVADALVFPASDQSTWIAGIVLDATGGGVIV